MNVLTVPVEDDNDPGFYVAPAGTTAPISLGYIGRPQDGGFFIRITPAQVDLPKGAPVDFTVHIKALQDFGTSCPLVVGLLPVLGRGMAYFAIPDTSVVSGKPVIELDGEKVVITMKKNDEAARVIVHTEYPPDWWGGSTKVRVNAGNSTPAASVEATVIVSDRVPAAWRLLV